MQQKGRRKIDAMAGGCWLRIVSSAKFVAAGGDRRVAGDRRRNRAGEARHPGRAKGVFQFDRKGCCSARRQSAASSIQASQQSAGEAAESASGTEESGLWMLVAGRLTVSGKLKLWAFAGEPVGSGNPPTLFASSVLCCQVNLWRLNPKHRTLFKGGSR